MDLDFEDEDLHGQHVRERAVREMGCDLALAGNLDPLIAPCGACRALGVGDYGEPSDETFLHTDNNITRWYHTVVCASCGTSGPWGRTESEALQRWQQIWHPELTAALATAR